jgi:hypothetical protein
VIQKWTRQSVEEFISRFERCRVRKEEWSHEAHLVAGFWYIHSLGAERALDRMRACIRNHNESVGTPNTDSSGYHETITCLYLHEIDGHRRNHPLQDFEACLTILLASELAKSSWPLTLYSRERLFSTQARREWVEPDIPHVNAHVSL